MTSGWEKQAAGSHRRQKRKELAEKFPSSLAELVEIAKNSSVKVKKLAAGVALNWRPSWMSSPDHFLYEKQTDDVPIPEPHIHVVD